MPLLLQQLRSQKISPPQLPRTQLHQRVNQKRSQKTRPRKLKRQMQMISRKSMIFLSSWPTRKRHDYPHSVLFFIWRFLGESGKCSRATIKRNHQEACEATKRFCCLLRLAIDKSSLSPRRNGLYKCQQWQRCCSLIFVEANSCLQIGGQKRVSRSTLKTN